jgi:outer membrane protein TolC
VATASHPGRPINALDFTTTDRCCVKNSSSILGAAHWELDIWGKVRSQTAASKEGLAVTQADYQYARMSLSATTAKVWYFATYAQNLRNYAQQNIKTSKQQLDIALAQFKVGKAEQQQADLAQAQLVQVAKCLGLIGNRGTCRK